MIDKIIDLSSKVSNLNEDTEDPIESLKNSMIFSSYDWSLDKKKAWVYGIIVGWDEVLPNIAEKFGWSEELVNRLKRLHNKFKSFGKERK